MFDFRILNWLFDSTLPLEVPPPADLLMLIPVRTYVLHTVVINYRY